MVFLLRSVDGIGGVFGKRMVRVLTPCGQFFPKRAIPVLFLCVGCVFCGG